MTKELQQRLEQEGIQYHMIKGGKALDVSINDVHGENIFTFWPLTSSDTSDGPMFRVDETMVYHDGEAGHDFQRGVFLGSTEQAVSFIKGKVDNNKAFMDSLPKANLGTPEPKKPGPKVVGHIPVDKSFKRFNENEDKLRAIIRERLMKGLEESDALYAKSESWKDAARKLKSELVTLLKNIEDDNYESGLKTIDDVISKLKMWKTKIQKHLK